MGPQNTSKSHSAIGPMDGAEAPSGHARSRTMLWLESISLIFLIAIVVGFVWHDLSGAYQDTLNFWGAVLTNSVNDRTEVVSLWINEKWAKAEVVAGNPSTLQLLTESTANDRKLGESLQQSVASELARETKEEGLLAGVVLNAKCQVAAEAGPALEVEQDFRTTCKVVRESPMPHIIATSQSDGSLRMHLAVPVLAAATGPRPGQNREQYAGVVVLISDPWRAMRLYLPQGQGPMRSRKTIFVWKLPEKGQVVVASPPQAVGEKGSLVAVPLDRPIFASLVARAGDVPFGRFRDYRGVPVFAAARKIVASGDSIASEIDCSEALAEFHRRELLEGTAGALAILLFGLFLASLDRRIKTQGLQEKLRQQEALLALEREAAASEAHYRELFENANDAIVMYDLEGKITDLNQAAEELSGYSRDEALKMNIYQVLPPEAQQFFPQNLEVLLAGLTLPVQETEIIAKDGRRVPMEARSHLVYRDGAPSGMQVIARDFTERKKAEETLRHRERELKEAQRLAKIGSWEWDIASDTVTWSDELYRIAQRDPNVPPPKFSEFSRIYPAETWEKLKPLVDNAVQSGEPYSLEMERIHPDGLRKWFVARGEAISDDAGKVVRLRGTVQDITDRKQADLELQESEKRFRRLSEASFEGVAFTDEGKFVVANDRLAEMLGCKAEDLTGSSVMDWVAPQSRETVMNHIRAASQEPYENFLRRKDGTIFAVETRARYLPWKGRRIRVTAIRDISDRKRAELMLRSLTEGTAADVGSDFFASLVRHTASALNAQVAFVAEMTAAGRLRTLACWNGAEPGENFEYDLENTASQRVMEGKSCKYPEKVRTFFPNDPGLETLGAESYLGVPLFDSTRKAIGLLVVIDSKPMAGDPQAIPILEIFAARAGAELERQRTLEELEREKNFTEAVIDSLPGFLYVVDQKGEVIRWNRNAETILGYSHDELASKQTLDVVAAEDRETVAASWLEAFAKGNTLCEARVSTKDGRKVPFILSAVRTGIGEATYIIGTGIDITERKLAEEALQAEKAFSDALVDSLPGVFYVIDADGHLVRWNKRSPAGLGYSDEELQSMGPYQYIPDEERSQTASRTKEALDKGSVVVEGHLLAKDGTKVPFIFTGVRAVIGGKVYVVGTGINISDRKRAEEALQASQEMFSKAFHSSPEPMSILTLAEGRFLDVNKAACDLVGYSRDEMIGRTSQELELTALAVLRKGQHQALEQGKLRNQEVDLRVKSGETRTLLVSLEMVEISGQACTLAQARDVTEHRRAEQALRASEQRYRDFITHSTEGVWRCEFDEPIRLDLPTEVALERAVRFGYIAECNDAMARIHGYTRGEDMSGYRLTEFRKRSGQQWIDSLRSGIEGGWRNRTLEFQTFDRLGNLIYLQRTEIPIVENGMVVRVWGMTRDVTNVRLAEEALRASEERYRLLFERSLAGVVRTTLEGQILECNSAFARIQGCSSREELFTSNIRELYLERSDGTSLVDLLRRQPLVMGQEFHSRRKDGTPLWLLVSASLVDDEQKGSTVLATAFDITHWKELGEQLRQSQKMEAVGRLAGGVAHDFNNMLQIINGYSELVIDQLSENDELRSNVHEIKNVVERAAGLTRQLLAFSRQQVLAPQILDLNLAVANLSKMLQRLIGEDVELIMTQGRPLSRVKADPGQIDQVILNLAVNARDAMPYGGKLVIETANVEIDAVFALAHYPMRPGPYVMVSVCDTGHGMDAATQSRIFEPFFTTKETGKGTGLGLATVYGIVKQSSGFIWVQSEPDKGTTFRIYLPPASEAAVVEEVQTRSRGTQGTETVLVVEDEEYVRSLVRRSLEAKGYEVLEASNGQEALRVAEQHQGSIDLVITDVVMPGMSGRELVERLSTFRPNTKTLYISGYANDALLHHGALDSGASLLQKPFSAEALAQKIRQALESS